MIRKKQNVVQQYGTGMMNLVEARDQDRPIVPWDTKVKPGLKKRGTPKTVGGESQTVSLGHCTVTDYRSDAESGDKLRAHKVPNANYTTQKRIRKAPRKKNTREGACDMIQKGCASCGNGGESQR